MNWSALGQNLLVTAAVTVTVFVATWLLALRLKLHRIVDVVWGLGFAVIAVVTLALSGGDVGRRLLVTALTVAWGLRLAGYIAWRGRGEGEDHRYAEILDRAQAHRAGHAFRVIYLPQLVVQWFVSLPVQAAAYEGAGLGWRGGLGITAYAGAAVCLSGIAFESIGDAQLARFRAAPANHGTVMERGLWRYTRHPNYFGDACVWWGVWLIACGHWGGAVTVLSPLLMTELLVRRTGKALTEKHLSATRPGYAEYVARTSGFFPLPPKRRLP